MPSASRYGITSTSRYHSSTDLRTRPSLFPTARERKRERDAIFTRGNRPCSQRVEGREETTFQVFPLNSAVRRGSDHRWNCSLFVCNHQRDTPVIYELIIYAFSLMTADSRILFSLLFCVCGLPTRFSTVTFLLSIITSFGRERESATARTNDGVEPNFDSLDDQTSSADVLYHSR